MRRAWIAGLIGLVLSTACDPTEADCRRLVTELNGSVERLRPARVTEDHPPDDAARSMRQFGTSVAKEADALAALALEAPALVTQRDAYVQAARRTSAAASGWADAIDARRRARHDADAAHEALDDDLDELEERCKQSTCYELMQRLAALARAPVPTLPEELEKLGADLGRITTDDPAIDAVVARHQTAVRQLTAALVAMRSAQAEVARHRETLQSAAAAESAVAKRIDGICRPQPGT